MKAVLSITIILNCNPSRDHWWLENSEGNIQIQVSWFHLFLYLIQLLDKLLKNLPWFLLHKHPVWSFPQVDFICCMARQNLSMFSWEDFLVVSLLSMNECCLNLKHTRTQTELACTDNISTVFEWMLLKFLNLLIDN